MTNARAGLLEEKQEGKGLERKEKRECKSLTGRGFGSRWHRDSTRELMGGRRTLQYSLRRCVRQRSEPIDHGSRSCQQSCEPGAVAQHF